MCLSRKRRISRRAIKPTAGVIQSKGKKLPFLRFTHPLLHAPAQPLIFGIFRHYHCHSTDESLPSRGRSRGKKTQLGRYATRNGLIVFDPKLGSRGSFWLLG
ncbi:hypothetical protein TNCT_393211 [Trichonephila clavata]|uniref:Uncharacterized protein n=1 Tax=Trichonephila clavata TaxID=2740835 RepID=A0A8X6F3T9_TRICU|nr:hypothetical protein TNCT_393211 [Trichonephila clavata]